MAAGFLQSVDCKERWSQNGRCRYMNVAETVLGFCSTISATKLHSNGNKKEDPDVPTAHLLMPQKVIVGLVLISTDVPSLIRGQRIKKKRKP
ncbi:uncharacterized protein V6R79_009783 [Siganus canaliculatus]